MMIYAHLKHLRVSKMEDLDGYEQTDIHLLRFLPFLMILVAMDFGLSSVVTDS